MKYLLDTHTFLWYFDDSEKLSKTAGLTILTADENIRKYGVLSVW